MKLNECEETAKIFFFLSAPCVRMGPQASVVRVNSYENF